MPDSFQPSLFVAEAVGIRPLRDVRRTHLVHTYGAGEDLPDPTLVQPFVTAGCCYYRDGRDSVAWHGDTGIDMVAIVSFGSPRKLLLRPRDGTGATTGFAVGRSAGRPADQRAVPTGERPLIRARDPRGSS